MPWNNMEQDREIKRVECGTTMMEVAEKAGVSLVPVNRITWGREQGVNKTFVQMTAELGCDVALTHKKKVAEWNRTEYLL